MEKQVGKVVNLYRDRNYEVYIGRDGHGQSGYFGNPFSKGTREENIKMYTAYFKARLKTDPIFKKKIHELKGKVLGCFCKPLACHGDVIVDYLNKLK